MVYFQQSTAHFLEALITVGYVLTRYETEATTKIVCQWENFEASCGPDEVVLVEEARYGRMQSNRCVRESGWGFDGCSADVLQYIDSLCSGRRLCSFGVPDATLDKSPHGCGDLKAYLEVSYTCLSVIEQRRYRCRNGLPVKLTESSGSIAKVITTETSMGSVRCPWLIEVNHGQTITLSLWDFSLWKDPQSRSLQSDTLCSVYAMVKDGSSSVDIPICGGTFPRVTKIFTSTTNQIYISISSEDRESYFLIKYEANGCLDMVAPEGMRIARNGNTLEVECTAERGGSVALQCVGNKWIPEGVLPNCTSTNSWWGLSSTFLSHHNLLIIILVSVALIVIIIILTIGICCLCRINSGQRVRLSDDSLDAVIGRYGMSPPAGELKELYPMLSKPDREPVDWERDYATTLQMRQMAHPLAAAVDPGHFQPNCCYCPVHGPQFDNTVNRSRKSSFRPHSDHIYEVPRFESEHCDDERSPAFYHELNGRGEARSTPPQEGDSQTNTLTNVPSSVMPSSFHNTPSNHFAQSSIISPSKDV